MTRSAEGTPLASALNASRVRGQAIGEQGCADVDHLPVGAVGFGEFAPHDRALSAQHPVLEQPAVEPSAVLGRPNRHTIACVDSDSFALLIAR